MNKRYQVQVVTWPENKDTLEMIRTSVFVNEQGVPVELEWDGQDESAFHILATDLHGVPIGTGRLLGNGHIGRMAVLPDWRRQGVGGAILKAILILAEQQHIQNLFLNAQCSAVEFYKKYGFKTVGDIFNDAGIPHRRMILTSE